MKQLMQFILRSLVSVLLMVFLTACNISTILPFALIATHYRQTTETSIACTKGNGEVITTLSGLQYEDLLICPGTGAKIGDMVSVHYVAMLENGRQFDSSYDRNEPFTFKLGTGLVIQGWDEGLIGMTAGSHRKLIIPPELAYGAQANGIIPANSTLIFSVLIVSVNSD